MATATDVNEIHHDDPPLSTLVGRIITDAQDLTKQQLELFKIEMRDNAIKAQSLGMLLALGSGIAAVAGVLLGFAFSTMLHQMIPSLPEWAAHGIVGLVLAAAAVVLFGVCKQKLDSFSILPEKAVEALQENLEWKTKPS